MLEKISVNTPKGQSLVDVSKAVQEAVARSGVQEGVCILVVPHTTAAVTINSNMDPRTAADISADVRRLVPTRVDFEHTYDTPSDAAGHIKTTLIGNSQVLIITGGRLLLGHSQGVFLFEFDGPRQRQVCVKVIEG